MPKKPLCVTRRCPPKPGKRSASASSICNAIMFLCGAGAMNGTSYQTARIDKCSVASERRERKRGKEKDEHEISRSDVCRLFIGRGEGAQRRFEEGDNNDRLDGCTVVRPGRKKVLRQSGHVQDVMRIQRGQEGTACQKHSSLYVRDI